MTVKDLRKFGTPRRIFRGSGLVRLSDGSEAQAWFTLAQLVDTQLLFIADTKRSVWDFDSDGPEVVSLTGRLLDGRSVSMQGHFLKEYKQAPQGKTRLIGYPSQWVVGEPDFREATSISFELVNFRFFGTEYEVFVADDKQGFALSLMPLNLGEREIKLRQITDLHNPGHADHLIYNDHAIVASLRRVDSTPESVDDFIGIRTQQHVPRDQFIVGGKAWHMCRTGQADPNAFGIFDMSGLWFVRGDLVRDVAALNKVELLPWDGWGIIEARDEDLSADDVALLDQVAELTSDDVPEFGRVRVLYDNDERLHVPSTIRRYSQEGVQTIHLLLG